MIDENEIEINFPLRDEDLIAILKGVEYTQQVHLHKQKTVRIKVFSSDRAKHISWDEWRKLCQAVYSNPELEQIIRDIEIKNSR